MEIFELSENNIPIVASLMARVKPDWWDYEGGLEQLSDIRNTVHNVGWYMGENKTNPRGWILCSDYACYSCLSIECLGYDDNGNFAMEEQLQPLIEQAETYARSKGYRILKYMIGSVDLSCHGRPLGNYAEELQNLKSYDRKHFDYFVKYGFKPTGFMPNCLGENYHCVIMIKELV
jgi:hypothetical protein